MYQMFDDMYCIPDKEPPIKIYEFTDNNQYTRREVYPNIEKPPDVPNRRRLPFTYNIHREIPIRNIYKIVYTDYSRSKLEVYTHKIASNICDEPDAFARRDFNKGEKEALLHVCIEKLPVDKQLKYENSMHKKFAEYDAIEHAKEARYKWISEWYDNKPPYTDV
jgi:hypothetical protein